MLSVPALRYADLAPEHVKEAVSALEWLRFVTVTGKDRKAATQSP